MPEGRKSDCPCGWLHCPATKAGASDLVLPAYSPEADGFKGTEVGMSPGCEDEERRLWLLSIFLG